jgi:tetratricopeptide (TPR) repeat protein
MKKIPGKVLLIFVLFLLPVQISSGELIRKQDPDYIFYKATSLYEAERYDEAIAEYTLLLRRGFESGPLYYNLGNCYFKKGEKGEAILNYERARRINPHDSDLAANYAHAKSMVARDDSKTSSPGHRRIFDSLMASMTVDGLTVLLSIIYNVFFLTLVGGWYLRSVKRRSIALLIALGVVFIAAGTALYKKVDLIDAEAIVIEERTEVKFEPFDRATNHSTLYEGTKVKVLVSKKDWVKIEGPGKKAGWVKAANIEKI